MSTFSEFVSTILADHKIDESEVPHIREYLYQDGRLDLEDVKLLVELYCSAAEYCTAFDDLFFDVLEKVILADGEIQPAEQFYLLKMIYSDRVIRDREREFLVKLRQTATITTPDFEALCDEALTAHSTAWSVGGN
ncbi:MAG: TerB family tellurite resistance protein [Candidatus Nealsonbacteria bacterium]|nr:TerB family tellurite resistance protein [Candidatus Nealsonbacteria bacterium]